MLLVLGEDQKEHLSLIESLSAEATEEFCTAATSCIFNGINPKLYSVLAEKYEIDIQIARRGVESLMNLFTESSKLLINEIDFQDSIILLDLNEESYKILLSHYVNSSSEIRRILSDLTMIEPCYKDLHWRLEVQIGSRAVNSQVIPKLMCGVDVEDSSKNVCPQLFEMDITTLKHVTQTLEQALLEMKSSHCRRIVRNIK